MLPRSETEDEDLADQVNLAAASVISKAGQSHAANAGLDNSAMSMENTPLIGGGAGRPVLVILGTGFAAMSLLERLNRDLYHVIVVSPRNYFLFTPLLSEWICGKVDVRSVIQPLPRPGRTMEYFQAECTGIDASLKIVECRSVEGGAAFRIAYDYLVIGTGTAIGPNGIPGVRDHAIVLKELPDAREIRLRVSGQFERAGKPGITDAERAIMLSFVVAGSGPAGIDFASALNRSVCTDLHEEYPSLTRLASVTVLDGSESTSNQFERTLLDYSRHSLDGKSVRILKGARVAKVTEDTAVLADGRLVSFGLLVWSAGTGPTKLVKSLDLPKDNRGRLLTDEFLHVIGAEDIFAAGDCAVVEATHLPQTAQTARQEGRYIAKRLNSVGSKKRPAPFRESNLGLLARLGIRRVLRSFPGARRSRFGAMLVWRAIYFSMSAPARTNTYTF